jgi:hypothetical protein
MSGLPAVVLSVREYVAYEKHLAVKMYCGDDPVLVASDVEYEVSADPIHGIETGLQIGKAAKAAALHSLAPCLKRFLRILVVGGKSQ